MPTGCSGLESRDSLAFFSLLEIESDDESAHGGAVIRMCEEVAALPFDD